MFGLDELHLIARGIGKQIYDMITVSNVSANQGSLYYYTNEDGSRNTQDYPFFISKSDLKIIGESIVKSRKYIPTSFQGSFDNVIEKTEGTRHIDWLDFFLYSVPTVVVPYLADVSTKKAVMSLVKGCSLALQWELTEDLLHEIQR
jgi:hypothetical protein